MPQGEALRLALRDASLASWGRVIIESGALFVGYEDCNWGKASELHCTSAWMMLEALLDVLRLFTQLMSSRSENPNNGSFCSLNVSEKRALSSII